jgi:RHS repeat-associated protein
MRSLAFIVDSLKRAAMTYVRAALLLLSFVFATSPSFAQGGEEVVYFHADAIGSVRLVTDANGQVVERYDYLPFGEPYPPSASVVETRRFGGKERDAETGLDYVGARYYASQTGRFTTVDPGHVNGDIFDPQSWNAYAYARNNPLKYTDPTGTEYEICAYGGSGSSGSCGSVSDQYFAILSRNPGAGIRLWGGAIFAGNKVVGYYNQTSIDPTLDDFIRQTGERTVALAKATAVEYAKQAAITAGTFGVGLAARASIEVMLASRSAILFKTGHYAARLLAAGVNVDRAEVAVQQLIKGGAPLQGTIRVDGVLLEYRAMRLADGRINVGTIFPQR